ncbi:nuclear transport factor 2 family protein [Bosea sp. BK604]|uniref:nuclear transport factor 2 family protein n=1 Tax=Bosea sp. BK604 TaxID=2512180 RepID=UPI001048E7CE|nr:nuclear transport factor 2 family protein [Bosea sp. BK604]TCR70444.1 SnoaL-like protein [Bosea sp. BK604]
MDFTVEQLVAEAQIRKLIHTYPRGLDRLDRDILLSIAHPEATVKFAPMFDGSWTAFVDWLMHAHDRMLFNNHRITNTLIEVRGDHAVSETSSTATLLVKRDDGDIEDRTVHSRYLDRWRRDDGRWALSHRDTIRDFRRVRIITEAELKATCEFNRASEIGRADPSYALFG